MEEDRKNFDESLEQNYCSRRVGYRDAKSAFSLLVMIAIGFFACLVIGVCSMYVNHVDLIKSQPALHQYLNDAGLNDRVQIVLPDSKTFTAEAGKMSVGSCIIVPALLSEENISHEIGYVSSKGELCGFTVDNKILNFHLLKDDAKAYAKFVFKDTLEYKSDVSLDSFISANMKNIDLYLTRLQYAELFATNTNSPN